MKKLFNLFLLMFFATLLSFNACFAEGNLVKNFSAYKIKNHSMSEVAPTVKNMIDSYQGKDNWMAVKNTQYTYVYSVGDENYYFRIYPANMDTNIFIVADREYDMKKNDITDAMRSLNYQYEELDDNEALREYKYDFYILARKQQLGSFYVSPDMIKPLKTGMSKLNNAMAKKAKKTSLITYSQDTDPINLALLETKNYTDNNAGISFIQKEYRLTQKENKYVHAFEYILVNNNSENVTVSATSERLAGLKDVTTESFIDLDRLDLLDTVSSSPPMLICTCGLSILGSVPNWIRLARITKESSRYAHALPNNYQLKAGEQMRILVLKYKNNPKPVKFDIQTSQGLYNIEF